MSNTAPVRAHLRGGTLAPGPDYDARPAILATPRDCHRFPDDP